MTNDIQKIRIIDSHTGGEPTRTIIGGFPELGSGSVKERVNLFKTKFDRLRTAVLSEPRGHAAMVGALVCRPLDEKCETGVIFFNNAGYLRMCGHGTIGLIKTLEYLDRIQPGIHHIETPAGTVRTELDSEGFVNIENVPSYRYAKNVEIAVENYGNVKGDVAWGGNWFFLIDEHSETLALENLAKLTDFAGRVRNALSESGITGKDGHEIDHIELFSPSVNANSKNFVLCPGGEYDRSPCGTGTSAKLACLYENGELLPGEPWKQESIIGSHFEACFKIVDEKIVTVIKGSAFITAESELIFDPQDPYRYGIVA